MKLTRLYKPIFSHLLRHRTRPTWPLVAVVTGIFFLGIYLGAITFYSINIAISVGTGDLNVAALRSKQLLYLTHGLSGFGIYPVNLAVNSSELLIVFNDLKNTTEDLLQSVTTPEIEDLTADWNNFHKHYLNSITKLREVDKLVHDPQFQSLMKIIGKQNQIKNIQDQTSQYLTSLSENQEVVALLPKIIGIGSDTPLTYTILFQNNLELRPTGGFMGSYMQLTFNQGSIQKIDVQDIYVPDGAIQGHVNPPEPIQQAFQQGWWRLRDSNFDPDFPTAAQAVSWFFEKGGVNTGQGIIAINLEVVEDLLTQMGTIALPDYDKEITAQNLYAVAQYESERGFFPGSTQKKDFFQNLVNNIFFQKHQLSPSQLNGIITQINTHLQQKNIQFYLKDPVIQQLIEAKNWAGKLEYQPVENVNNDFFYSVDANLGANKANCCIEKSVNQVIVQLQNEYQITTKITYTNKSPVDNPMPPKFWGGDYKNYTRILLPMTAQVDQIVVSNNDQIDHQITLLDRDSIQLSEYGFFIQIPHLQTVTVEITHTVPLNDNYQTYALAVKRQSGIPPYPHQIQFHAGSTNLNKNLTIDQDYLVKF